MSPSDLGLVQAVRKRVFEASALFGIALLVLTGPFWSHPVHRLVEAGGLLLITLCIVGRTLCSIYISGHKSSVIVDSGPYSVCRNPLYVFSLLGAIGIGALSGSIIVSATFGAITWIVQRVVISKEEAFLLTKHGSVYRTYLQRVPRFWPKFSLWHSGETIVVRPRGVLQTFADASLFLLAIPIVEIIERLKELGWIPVILQLP